MLGSAGYLGPSLADATDAVIRDYCRHWGTFDADRFRRDCVDYDAKLELEISGRWSPDLGANRQIEVLINPRSRIHRYITVSPRCLGVSENGNLVILSAAES
jgi:hypothetical protein